VLDFGGVVVYILVDNNVNIMNISFRKLESKDLSDHVRWFNDPEVSQYLGEQIRNGTTLEKQKKWFSSASKDNASKTFVIEVDKKPVGNVSLIEINNIDKNAGVSVFIGEKEYWGKGVAKKALEFIIDQGFTNIDIHKLWIHVFEPNKRAIKFYKKTGFIQEGYHTEMVRIDDKYYDEIFMSMTNPNHK